MEASQKTNWRAIITFYILALTFSWSFRFWEIFAPDSFTQLPMPVRNLSRMWGPGLAAIVCFYIFKKSHRKTVSLFGSSFIKSALFFGLPFIVWALLLLFFPQKEDIQLSFLAILIPFGFLMTLGEELGWRGFLQDAFGQMKEWKKWLLIGLMWEFWHYRQAADWMGQLQTRGLMLASVLALTVILGKATDRTKSLMVPITLHAWANLQIEFGSFNAHLAGVISLIIWGWLLWKWPQSNSLNPQKEP